MWMSSVCTMVCTKRNPALDISMDYPTLYVALRTHNHGPRPLLIRLLSTLNGTKEVQFLTGECHKPHGIALSLWHNYLLDMALPSRPRASTPTTKPPPQPPSI